MAGFDAIVVGAGPNGLAAATRLAHGGRKVVVLERNAAIGGLSAAREFHPGYIAPGILHDDGLMSPRVVAALGLAGHGLTFRDAPPVLLAEAGARGLLLPRDPAAAGELAARSPHDADAYTKLRAFLATLAPLGDRLMTSPPPPLSPHSKGELWEVVRAGLGVWKLGKAETLELLRVAPMCVADFLNESFETPLLVEGLAAGAVLATWAGPWSAGTTTNFLLREGAPGREIAGGPPALVAALERAARAAGVEIRTGAEVERLAVADDRIRGARLASGETIDAVLVVATCDPKRTLLGLLPPGTLPVAKEEEARRIRSRGTAAKIHLALSGPLPLAGRESVETIRIGGGHVDDLERAFDAIKYRQFSARPQLDVRVPTVADPKLAPAGHHVLSIVAGFVPFALDGGWSEARRTELLEAVLDQLERHAPGTRGRVVASEVLDPARLEAELALTGGQLHHVEPALDQLLVLRPSAGTARYATAVGGLFLGGSGSHGGGGVTCAAGLLAAETALAGRPSAA